jgi:hypothetical protein
MASREYNTNHRFKINVPDKFGRVWPDLPALQRCDVCGQPDTEMDCNHTKLTDAEVDDLGGTRVAKE